MRFRWAIGEGKMKKKNSETLINTIASVLFFFLVIAMIYVALMTWGSYGNLDQAEENIRKLEALIMPTMSGRESMVMEKWFITQYSWFRIVKANVLFGISLAMIGFLGSFYTVFFMRKILLQENR